MVGYAKLPESSRAQSSSRQNVVKDIAMGTPLGLSGHDHSLYPRQVRTQIFVANRLTKDKMLLTQTLLSLAHGFQ